MGVKLMYVFGFLRVVLHWAEFSARSDTFFCLLTPTPRQLVFKQENVSLRGKFRLVENGLYIQNQLCT